MGSHHQVGSPTIVHFRPVGCNPVCPQRPLPQAYSTMRISSYYVHICMCYLQMFSCGVQALLLHIDGSRISTGPPCLPFIQQTRRSVTSATPRFDGRTPASLDRYAVQTMNDQRSRCRPSSSYSSVFETTGLALAPADVAPWDAVAAA